jgi:hypothetical protein
LINKSKFGARIGVPWFAIQQSNKMIRLCSLLLWPALASAAVVINEASDKGTAGTCDGEDWIELANTGADAIVLNGYRLCDVEYCTKDKVLTFFDT